MRAPDFWQDDPSGWPARLLRPIGAIYGAVASARMRRLGFHASVPVICVGNFTVGGAGKTPTAAAMAHALKQLGHTPFFLSRGYGGRLEGPVRVDPKVHDAREVGDEPLLLAKRAPVIVSRNRPAGARLAVEEGASVIIMDDGLQNPSLAKELSVAVVDAVSGFGNGLCLPAGPMRAPADEQWQHIDAIVLIGQGAAGDRIATEGQRRGLAVLRARLDADPMAASRLKGRPIIAFAGIGRPEKFFQSLRSLGAELVETVSFADHHVYSARDLAGLSAKARSRQALLATTEKDAIRIGPAWGAIGLDGVTLPVSLVFENHQVLNDLLEERLGQREDAEA